MPALSTARAVPDVPTGDPILCRANTLMQFGHAIFPRGAYLMGHLGSYKDPGHFFGKGYLRLEFDLIGLPNTDLPVAGKVTAVRGYRVNREGDIVGHGHPTRDLVEWLLPPLWPWKVLTLPARGPRPVLKGEVPIVLRLMDTVVVPHIMTPIHAVLANHRRVGYSRGLGVPDRYRDRCRMDMQGWRLSVQRGYSSPSGCLKRVGAVGQNREASTMPLPRPDLTGLNAV